MINLKFDEEKHEYSLGNKKIPSVSQIMSSITTHYYNNSDIPPVALEIACNKGHQVHQAILDYEQWGEYDIDEQYDGYIQQYLSWKNEYNPIILYQEKMLTNGKWAGTLDYICEINGEVWLIDHKTSNKLHMNFLQVQEQGYKELCGFNEIKIDRFGALQLRKDRYSFVEVQPNKEMWDKAYECYKFGNEEKQ